MKKLLVTTLISALLLSLSACGAKEEAANNEPATTVLEEAKVDEEQQEDSITERYLPDSNYSELGKGTAYLSTIGGGTSADGKIPVLFISPDITLTQIGLNTLDFNNDNLSFIYIDGNLLSKEQLGDSQINLDLENDNLSFDVHKVEIVQYENDDPTANMLTYKTASFEIK